MKISYLVYLNMNNLSFYVHCYLVENRNKRNKVSFSYEKCKPIRTHDLTL